MQYFSYDRGYDVGQSDARETRVPTIARSISKKAPSGKPWKMVVAVAMVTIMVASGFVMIAPTLKFNLDKSKQTAPKDNPADIAIGGTHYVNTTISNMFESYQKVPTGNGGFHSGALGVNEWWTARNTAYGDVIVRSAYPFVIGYNPYSAEVPASGVSISTMKYGLYSFYKTTIDAPSITTISTGSNMPLGFIPILGTPWTTYSAMSGGWVNWSYYVTYCTSADTVAATSGTSYMLSYYGVTPAQFNFGGSRANDGWYVDFQGKADFNRAAAKKFLGLTGSASLITQFNANNTGANLGNMNASWSAFWMNDGSNTGYNDTYACYDYGLDNSGAPFNMFLSVDPTSTANKLVLRIYGINWGTEELMVRYLDRSGVQTQSVTSPEDWYLNGTASPTGADIHSRMVSVYSMVAWKDLGFYSTAWSIDTLHIDYTPNNPSNVGTGGKWLSRYNPYMATKTFKPTYMTWSPGTLTYETGCAYYYPPMNWNLLANEKLTVQLPSSSKSVAGYMPYKGTGAQDTLNAAKLTELGGDWVTNPAAGHLVWGELGLGSTIPSNLRSGTYYDSASKTLTLTGPMTFARNPNSAFNYLNATGTPDFSFDVMRVSNYEISPGTLPIGTSTLTVTAKNVTGAVVGGGALGTDWNGTVNLTTASAGINFGGKSWVLVHFSNRGGGVATTQVTVTTSGTKTVTATDVNNSLDIVNTVNLSVNISEFPTLLIPMIGIMAAVIITVGRRDKKKDEQ